MQVDNGLTRVESAWFQLVESTNIASVLSSLPTTGFKCQNLHVLYTTVVCAVSPAPGSAVETLSSLRFAERAKKVKNVAKVGAVQ